jgi:hypothetical protein
MQLRSYSHAMQHIDFDGIAFVTSGAGSRTGKFKKEHEKYVSKVGAKVGMKSLGAGYCAAGVTADAIVLNYYDDSAKMFYSRNLPRRRNANKKVASTSTMMAKATRSIDVPEHLSN